MTIMVNYINHKFFLENYPAFATKLPKLEGSVAKLNPEKDYDLIDSWAEDYMIIFDCRLSYLREAYAHNEIEEALESIKALDQAFWQYRPQLDKYFGLSVSSWLSAPHDSSKTASTLEEAHELCLEALRNPFVNSAKDEFEEMLEALLDLSKDGSDPYQNSYFQNIVSMGDRALPYILRGLVKNPAILLPALEVIAGEKPIIKTNGTLEDIIAAWIHWGIYKKYLPEEEDETSPGRPSTIVSVH